MSVTYDLRDFTEEQKVFFKKAEEEGIDVSYIYNPEFSTDQMIEICEGLQDGLNVTPFADPKYSWEQMQEICEAIRDNIDYTKLTNPDISPDEMHRIRMYLVNPANYKYDIETLQTLFKQFPKIWLVYTNSNASHSYGSIGTIKQISSDSTIDIDWEDGVSETLNLNDILFNFCKEGE